MFCRHFTLSCTSLFFSLGGEILSSSDAIELFIYPYLYRERERANALAAVLSSTYLFFVSTSAVACRWYLPGSTLVTFISNGAASYYKCINMHNMTGFQLNGDIGRELLGKVVDPGLC